MQTSASADTPHRPVSVRFGMKVRALRKEQKFTQDQLAKKLGIDRSYLSDVERGTRSISINLLEIFALGFGMSPAGLLEDL